MGKKSFILFIAGICLFLMAPALYAKSMYVKSLETYLLDQPNYKANKTTKIVRGTEVLVLETQGSWLKIQIDQKEGWLHKMVVSSRPPRQRVSLLSQNVDIASKARRRASAYSSTAAARGLTSSDRKRASQINAPDFDALRKIEGMDIDEAEAVAFIQE